MLLIKKLWLIVALLGWGAVFPGIICAAQGDAQAGNPPATTPSGTVSGSGQTTSNQPSVSGNPGTPTSSMMAPLTGAFVLTPGIPGVANSYVVPTFGYTGYADTNPTGYSSGAGGGVALQSTYNGSLDLQLIQRHAQFNLKYAGGAFFYSDQLSNATIPTTPFGTFQQLGVFEQVNTRHWKWTLGDEFMYLPEMPNGFFGFGGLSSFGSGMGGSAMSYSPSWGSAFSPTQAILTGQANRISNSALTQLEYDPSARSSFTATASYGTLQFLEPGFIDNRYWVINAGYNYRISSKDEIGISYAHYYFKYNGSFEGVLNRGFSVLYGHQITGRLSLQLSLSPLVNQIAQPLGGASTKAFVGTYDSLQYKAAKWDAAVSFDRMTQGGSGVVAGAETDWLSGNFGWQLSRKIRATLHGSHSYTQSLEEESSQVSRSKFEYWQAGFELTREFGRHISMYVNYYFQRQTSNTAVCNGTNCSDHTLRQVGGVGINWHTQPIRID
ncbi:MAG TPA: hypothetical protein VMW38_27045 [Terriglobia bacterium]|nr:hypothetical protein [Terriglobia bacterium]